MVVQLVLLWGAAVAYGSFGVITTYDAWKMREPLVWLLPPMWFFIAGVCVYAAVTS